MMDCDYPSLVSSSSVSPVFADCTNCSHASMSSLLHML